MPGSNECIIKLGYIEQQFKESGSKIVLDWAKETMEESKNSFCPVDKGLLKSTGAVNVTKNTLTEYKVTLQYGGSGCNYAVKVHETPLSYRNGKTWKFLSTPFDRRAPILQSRLQAEIGKVLK